MPDETSKTKPERFKEIIEQAGPVLASAQANLAGLGQALQAGRKLFEEMSALCMDALTELAEHEAGGAAPPDEKPTVPVPPEVPVEKPPPSPFDDLESEPKVPATPVAAMHYGTPESYLNAALTVERSVTVSTGMSPEQIKAVVMTAECNRPGSAILVKTDPARPVMGRLQLGHVNGINGPNGEPLRDVAIFGEFDPTGDVPVIQGIQLAARQDAHTGCGNNVRLEFLEARPDGSGRCIIIDKGAERSGAHLVGCRLTVRAIPDGTGYQGTGGKWGLLHNGARLTLKDFHAASAFEEHALYLHGPQGGVYIDGARNTPSVIVHPGTGRKTHVGMGRTFFQCISRGNEVPMPWGDITLRNVRAEQCGWQSLPEWIDEVGDLDPNYKGGQGGGSALTFAGVVRGRVRIDDYIGLNNYCSELAVWPEREKGVGGLKVEPTETNPEGIRAYLTGLDGVPFNPTDNKRPAEGYSVTDLDVDGFLVKRDRATRPALLLDGLGRARFRNARVFDAPLGSLPHEVRLNQYPWATPCGPVEFA